MIRYGKKKTTYKIHPHNECGICSPEAGDSNLARQEAKKEIEKELIEYLEEDKKMGYLQEISACKRSADECKFLEEWLLKAIENNNKELLLFCKETLYKRYREQIVNSEEFAEENPFIVTTFERL